MLIPLAERSGEIIDIGRWVLQRAWSDRRRWQSHHANDLSVSVNVSAHQLMSAGFAETVAAVLDTASTDPSLLTLEVTESIFVRDGERARHVLNDLKDMGVMLALDDFGTGYSSLGYLRSCRWTASKSTKNSSRISAPTAPITRSSAPSSNSPTASGSQSSSEGVETLEQHRELTALRCDYCQGFYFARPMPTTSLDTLMQAETRASAWILPHIATAH